MQEQSDFGRGFVVNLMLLSRHFGLPPERAFYGAADHLTELTVPESLRGTEVDELIESLRKKVIWHQPGMMDKEDVADIRRLLNRIGIAIDRHLGIPNPDAGKYD